MNKIKTLFIAPGPTYNAHSQICQTKFLALSPFVQGYLLSSGDTAETFKMNGFEYRSCARKNKFNNLRLIFFCLLQAIKIRKLGGVDCIVTYDPLKTGFIGVLLKRFLNAKLIVEVNGVYTSSVVWEENNKNFIARFNKILIPMLMQFVFSMTNGIYLLFPTQIKQFHKTVQRKKIASFPCWVPVSFFQNVSAMKEILFVGFPFRIKGVDILIKAFKNIAPMFPEWKLKILGWYPDFEELEKEIDGHTQIYHTKPVSYSDMPHHIGTCSILVLPSRTEAMGRVLVEAAAAGKARIGSNVDGVPTVINDNVDGLLFSSESVSELGEKMSLLMSDTEMREKIGQAAKKRASVDFSEELFVKNTVAFYKDVLKK